MIYFFQLLRFLLAVETDSFSFFLFFWFFLVGLLLGLLLLGLLLLILSLDDTDDWMEQIPVQ